MTETIKQLIHRLRPYTDRHWYPFLLAFLAFVDHFIVIIPSDGLLVTSTLLTPRRWFSFFTIMGLGSSLGAVLLAWLIKLKGISFLVWLAGPDILHSEIWKTVAHYMDLYGLWALMISSLAPIVQHPAIAMAALSKADLTSIFLAFLVGRLIKYYIIAWGTSHTPKLINKLWGVRGEVHDLRETFPHSSEETPHSKENVN